jgi:Mg-chelatase subunit ChlD
MTTAITHIYFLLDRSGSMASMADDVIGGFNTFVAEQALDGPDALVTLVQFDGGDPHEVITAAAPIREVPPLTSSTFVPRGNTPLFDAMGRLITDATIRAEELEDQEVIMFVTFTDGAENASRDYGHAQIFDLVKNREARGWTFVYLGANQDSYATGRSMGFGADQVQDFEASSEGASLAFSSLSKGLIKERGKLRANQARSASVFFEGDKEAEAALRRKP